MVKTSRAKLGRIVAAVVADVAAVADVAGEVLAEHKMTADLMSRLLKRDLTTTRLGIFVLLKCTW